MTQNIYADVSFLTSAVKLSQLPDDVGIEVAFAGRSNAGKSSALNALTQQTNLARTSKTPGRTQMINVFSLDEQRRLIDLPGYGYAKVPQAMKERWQKTLSLYLESRDCLTGLVLLMDIRHPLKELDLNMVRWAHTSNLPIHILLTKSDKFKRGAAMQTLMSVKKELAGFGDLVSLQLFSAKDKSGLDELIARLTDWFFKENV